MNVFRRAKELGIVVAAGHTNATCEEAVNGFDAGITICNHLFNDMRCFHHREPGIIGACLLREGVYAEIIADMIHLHPEIEKMMPTERDVDNSLTRTETVEE